MAQPLVSDALWAVIEPLLPVEAPKPKGGRPRLSDRAVLTGMFGQAFVHFGVADLVGYGVPRVRMKDLNVSGSAGLRLGQYDAVVTLADAMRAMITQIAEEQNYNLNTSQGRSQLRRYLGVQSRRGGLRRIIGVRVEEGEDGSKSVHITTDQQGD